jgi:pyrroline-5-carboxylate reductase
MTIGIIGSGKMGQALIKGLLAHGVSRRAIRAADESAAIRAQVRRRFRVSVTNRNAAVARQADVLILAVKPQQLPQALAELSPSLGRRQLVISIAAGITLRWLQRRLPGTAVIRVMPNLPATVGCGFAAMAAGRAATPRHRAIARELFEAVGDVVELPERHFNAITAVSGSGPAYVFFLVHAWERAARSLGLPGNVARRAIRRTLDGSLRLLEGSGEPPEVLIAKVASKRGTTEAALKVLGRRRVLAHFIEALQAAARRSKELAWRR